MEKIIAEGQRGAGKSYQIMKENAELLAKSLDKRKRIINKALVYVDSTIDIIKNQPSNNQEDDMWILHKLYGIKDILSEDIDKF